MLKIKINKDKIIDYKQENGLLSINEQEIYLSIIPTGKDTFHILKDDKSFNAEVISFNEETKTFRFKINGRILEAEVKDRLDLLLDSMGLGGKESQKISNLKAPMPGLIAEIMVKEDQEVENGEPLLILEAMKMENMIKSPGKGVIKSIRVTKGQSVEKNQVLIQF